MNVDTILAQLKIDEDAVALPYDDHDGRVLKAGDILHGALTGGIGRNLSAIPFSEAEMEFMCRNDIERATATLDRKIPEWRSFPEDCQNGLVNLTFTLGNKIAEFVQMIAALAVRDFKTAAAEVLDSNWHEDVGDGRANRVADMIRGEKLNG